MALPSYQISKSAVFGAVCTCARHVVKRAYLHSTPNIKLTSNNVSKSYKLDSRPNPIQKGYCTNQSPSSNFPQLMDFPVFIWPNIFKSVKNTIMSKFIISRYFDREFNMKDFTAGSKRAVEVVSNYIAKGNLKGLNGLVTPDVIAEISKGLHQFSLKQGTELAINQDDIFLSFPYEVGVILPDEKSNSEGDEAPQKRFVEITMCYHVITGLSELSQSSHASFSMINFPEVQGRLYILNYRFVRNFTKGSEPTWIINGLNHFKPMKN